VVVSCVDFGGIVNHQCLNCFFIIWTIFYYSVSLWSPCCTGKKFSMFDPAVSWAL